MNGGHCRLSNGTTFWCSCERGYFGFTCQCKHSFLMPDTIKNYYGLCIKPCHSCKTYLLVHACTCTRVTRILEQAGIQVKAVHHHLVHYSIVFVNMLA